MSQMNYIEEVELFEKATQHYIECDLTRDQCKKCLAYYTMQDLLIEHFRAVGN